MSKWGEIFDELDGEDAVRIMIPILEAAPLIYDTLKGFVEMIDETGDQLAGWKGKSPEERKAALDLASRRFDGSVERFRRAAELVRAKKDA